ncbi:MAG: S1 family peptidase [Armatimonadota bacterium]
MNSRYIMFVVLCAVMGCCLLPVKADDGQAARAIIDKTQGAVVTLEIVVKSTMSMFGDSTSKEEKYETSGTIIDPSGLVVTSLAMTDLMGFFMDAMGGMGGADGPNTKPTSEITSLKIVLGGGKELPAKIILRDKDLDLAFIRPVKAPEQLLTAVDLTQTSSPALLDELLVVGRYGASANRVITASMQPINAILEKPRKFYVLGGQVGMMSGPAFTLDGKLAGILVLRKSPKMSSSVMSMMGGAILPVILPAADVADVAKQAPANVPTQPVPPPANKGK